ncbi:Uncharacterised protein [Moraxella ovis]|nr:Uncharacterised protein [Moraxella ovis]STZ05712.1 Uncharacterised protein [Moraxella ovis]
MSLFRQEALDTQKTNWTGTIILTRPVSFAFIIKCFHDKFKALNPKK